MNVHNISCPNFGQNEISVEFLVLHYTACSLERALEIFCDPARKLSAQFVLAENGDVYDLGNFMNGPIRQGAHAGESVWKTATQEWRTFNLFSIGVEIVNLNGNLFAYTEAQYTTLVELTLQLRDRFPALRDPERIVGHEQIAGFRGKSDPGIKFEWARVFSGVYGPGTFPERKPLCSDNDLQDVRRKVAEETKRGKTPTPQFWSDISSQLEQDMKRKVNKT